MDNWLDKAIYDGAIIIEAAKKLHKNEKVNQILQKAIASGWRPPEGNANEQVWKCPCGKHTVTIHSTLGDKGRVGNNVKSHFRQCEMTRHMF